MARDEDEAPKAKSSHDIGQDLSLLSVAECEGRIAILESEIGRLRAALVKKQATRDAARRFFK